MTDEKKTQAASLSPAPTERIIKLSDEVARLDLPQQSEAFVRKLRAAIAQERIEGVYNGEKFVLPKQFTNLSRQSTRQKNAKDMLVLYDAAYIAWFDEVQGELSSVRPRSEARVPVTPEAFFEGKLDWKAMLAQTRQNIQSKQERGAKLGLLRQKESRPAPKRAAPTRSLAAAKK